MIGCTLLALCTGPLVPGDLGEVRDIALSELVRFSDVIVVGKVERVFEVARKPPENAGGFYGFWTSARQVPVAEVSVLRGHEGADVGDTVFFLAASTWTCDITTAIPGETVLLFLHSPGWVDRERADLRSELARRTRGAPVWQVAHSGRGRMPLRTVEGCEYATRYAGVVLSRDLPVIVGPEPEHSWTLSVQLDRIEKRIGEIVAAQLPYLRAQCRLPLTPDRGWDLRVWGDGHGLLVVEDPKAEVRRELRFEAERMARLGDLLAEACASELPQTIGRHGLDGPRRQLAIRTRDAALDLEILTVSPDRVQGEEPRREAARALELWAEIRGLFAEPRTLDHRSYDRAWIEAWR